VWVASLIKLWRNLVKRFNQLSKTSEPIPWYDEDECCC